MRHRLRFLGPAVMGVVACGGLGMRGTGPDGTSVEIIDPALEVDRDMDAETVGDSLLVRPGS
ncbi:hypothetical protein [uncultured Microbacterium sp.]|uniref:Uncharacterized protein n=1 Tax=uncultured Microbacterium sp. TaxID=191216 RepID=A0A1Y5NUQ5_9MICO|nr:hypothetical protein [uncultured Microbacterium sp.]SBS70126.1 exported hypothetical protein [uncultured Microbacterium sp.]